MSEFRVFPLAVAIAALFASGGAAFAQSATPRDAVETPARQAIIMDFETGRTLFAKNADEPLPPASMSKLMTVAIVFEKLATGEISLDDRFRVSRKAWQFGGSMMFVREGDRIRVEDLLRGVVIQSGNDAAVVLAEGIAGSEEAFVEIMNDRARAWGLANSTFANATGWPDPDHLMSARDLATLARRIISRYPDFYEMFAETSFKWEDIAQNNRNPLLFDGGPGDGLKTGHTDEAGYCLVGSAIVDGVRRIIVVGGLDSDQARRTESRRLMRVALTDFETVDLFRAGDLVAEAGVAKGAHPATPLVAGADVSVIVHRRLAPEVKAYVTYDAPLPAPVRAGEPVASLRVEAPGLPVEIYPLTAGKTVEETGFGGKVLLGLQRILKKPDEPKPVEERLGAGREPMRLQPA